MTFARTLLFGALTWVAGITFLHAWLNWHSFDRGTEAVQAAEETAGGRASGEKFRVGFLPVT